MEGRSTDEVTREDEFAVPSQFLQFILEDRADFEFDAGCYDAK